MSMNFIIWKYIWTNVNDAPLIVDPNSVTNLPDKLDLGDSNIIA